MAAPRSAADEEAQDYDDRRGHDVQSADLTVRVTQDLCHGDGLCVFFDDDLGQEIDQDHVDCDRKAVDQSHHASH